MNLPSRSIETLLLTGSMFYSSGTLDVLLGTNSAFDDANHANDDEAVMALLIDISAGPTQMRKINIHFWVERPLLSMDASQLTGGGVKFGELLRLDLGRCALAEATLFQILTMTPALKYLGLGQILCDTSQDLDTNRTKAAYQPACQLRHFSIYGGRFIHGEQQFTAYKSILSQSVLSLKIVEVSYVKNHIVCEALAAALQACVSVRSLEVTNCNFTIKPLVDACPLVRELAVSWIATTLLLENRASQLQSQVCDCILLSSI